MTTDEKLAFVLKVLDEKKARDVEVMDVRDRTLAADYFVIASGTSNTHIKATADGIIKDGRDAGLGKIACEGYTQGKWVLVDLGDIIVHLFSPEEREFYDLETLWKATAEKLDEEGGEEQ